MDAAPAAGPGTAGRLHPGRVSLGDMERLLPQLEPAEFAVLARRVVKVKAAEAGDLAVLAQLRMLLWGWLKHLGFVSDAQAEDLVRPDGLAAWALELARFVDPATGRVDRARLPRYQLTLLEHRYAHWSGLSGFHDFVYGEAVAELPEPAVTFIACDLTALFCRARDRLARLKEHADAQPPAP